MTTLAEALAEFTLAREAQGLAPATLRSETFQLRAALTALAAADDLPLDEAPLELLTPASLRAHLAAFRSGTDARFADSTDAPRRAPSSVRARLQALRSFTRWALTEELISTDPARSLQLRTPAPVRTTSCTRSEIDDLLRAAALGRAPERDRLLLLLPLTLGATLAEITALTLGDLDLAAAEITLARVGHERILPLASSCLAALEAWLPVREARLQRLGSTSDRLLVTALAPEKPLVSEASLGRAIARCFQRAGVPAQNLGVQRLRASFATLALDAGASPRELQDVLGVELAALRQLARAARPSRPQLRVHPLADL